MGIQTNPESKEFTKDSLEIFKDQQICYCLAVMYYAFIIRLIPYVKTPPVPSYGEGGYQSIRGTKTWLCFSRNQHLRTS